MSKPRSDTYEALIETLISANEPDSNLEAANVVDGLFAIARAIRYLADTMDDIAVRGGKA